MSGPNAVDRQLFILWRHSVDSIEILGQRGVKLVSLPGHLLAQVFLFAQVSAEIEHFDALKRPRFNKLVVAFDQEVCEGQTPLG